MANSIIENVEPARIMELLPREFERFKQGVSDISGKPQPKGGKGREESTEKHGDPERGYQWQTIFLPNGTMIGMSYGGRNSCAEIRHEEF